MADVSDHAGDFPELRAAVALGVVIPLFFVLFATIYLSMSDASGTTFTQGLDHTRALYFTITIFSTVGFGDITPATDTARLVVSAQMILDLILIGGVVQSLLARPSEASASGRNRIPRGRARLMIGNGGR